MIVLLALSQRGRPAVCCDWEVRSRQAVSHSYWLTCSGASACDRRPPLWRKNANAPDVRLAMVERTSGLMRRRTAGGDECFVVAKNERWLRLSAEQVVQDRFLADGFEAGYVWDAHLVSVGNKQLRKPKKDGWFEHGQNCAEYLELTFGSDPAPPSRREQKRREEARRRQMFAGRRRRHTGMPKWGH